MLITAFSNCYFQGLPLDGLLVVNSPGSVLWFWWWRIPFPSSFSSLTQWKERGAQKTRSNWRRQITLTRSPSRTLVSSTSKFVTFEEVIWSHALLVIVNHNRGLGDFYISSAPKLTSSVTRCALHSATHNTRFALLPPNMWDHRAPGATKNILQEQETISLPLKCHFYERTVMLL